MTQNNKTIRPHDSINSAAKNFFEDSLKAWLKETQEELNEEKPGFRVFFENIQTTGDHIVVGIEEIKNAPFNQEPFCFIETIDFSGKITQPLNGQWDQPGDQTGTIFD